jgi:hypothetical protein
MNTNVLEENCASIYKIYVGFKDAGSIFLLNIVISIEYCKV